MRNALTASLLLAGLAGCPDRTISEVNPEQGRVESKKFPVDLNRDVDILFVVDNSGSMADKQANLRANFPNFIDVLSTIEGGLPSVHLGVVTSDMGVLATDGTIGPRLEPVGMGGCADRGDNGALQTVTPVTGAFIEDIKNTDGSRTTNYGAPNTLASVFGNMASVGAGGCGFEQHLHAMQTALTAGKNPGFIRDNAFLAIIFLADEDDCSASHSTLWGPDGGQLGFRQSFRCTKFGVTCDVNGKTVDEMAVENTKDQCHPNDASQFLEQVSKFVTFLKGLKADDSKIIVAGIIGEIKPFKVEPRTINMQEQPALGHSCSYNPDNPGVPCTAGVGNCQVADPPVRIDFFLRQFLHNTVVTICQEDLSAGLQQIGELLRESLGNPCITGKLHDLDPSTPQIEPECAVSVIKNFNTPAAQETPLPECNQALSNQPCWHIVKDVANCPCNTKIDPTCNPANAFDNLVLRVEGSGLAGDDVISGDCVTDAQ